MLRNSKYINENIIIEDGKNTTKEFGKPAQVGYDLSVKNIYTINGVGVVTVKKTYVPEYVKIEPKNIKTENTEFEGWYLPKGNYILETNEGVHFGNNDTGYVIMRSSLNRVGATIHSAVWDPNFTSQNGDEVNTMTIRLTVENENGFMLEKNARVAQIIIWENEDTVAYNGQFQGGLKKSNIKE